MSQIINFFAQNQRKLEEREKNDRRSFFLVGGFSLVSIIFFAILFSIGFYYQTQLNHLKTQITNANQEISNDNQQEKSYLSFYSKLNKIQELIQKRSPGTQSLKETYLHFTTKNIALSNATYDYYTKNLELTLISNSVFSLPELFSLIHDQEWRQQYQKIELSSLNRSDNGIYTLKMSLEL
jgi:hypothetical protein